MTYVLLALGLVFLFAGGEFLVKGAVALAQRLGVSPLVIGLTIVGFGTSTPELLVSVQAALNGQPDIATGNVIGSNISNILLILGCAALICPIACTPSLVYRDGLVMGLSAVLLTGLCLYGTIGMVAGILMLVLLVLFMGGTYYLESTLKAPSAELREEETELIAPAPMPVWKSLGLLIGGIALLMAGASWLVESAVFIAKGFGVPEHVIGLTLVAVGTSLPELATSVIAALRKNADVAAGNVVGSNIFNILGILGVTAIVQPIPVNPSIVNFDIWVMLGVSVGVIPFLITGWRISRREAVLFLALYGLYIGSLV